MQCEQCIWIAHIWVLKIIKWTMTVRMLGLQPNLSQQSTHRCRPGILAWHTIFRCFHLDRQFSRSNRSLSRTNRVDTWRWLMVHGQLKATCVWKRYSLRYVSKRISGYHSLYIELLLLAFKYSNGLCTGYEYTQPTYKHKQIFPLL